MNNYQGQRCELFFYPYNDYDQCQNIATEEVTVGCVHEHVTLLKMCKHCIDDAAKEINSICCTRCYEVDQHECLMTVIKTLR